MAEIERTVRVDAHGGTLYVSTRRTVFFVHETEKPPDFPTLELPRSDWGSDWPFSGLRAGRRRAKQILKQRKKENRGSNRQPQEDPQDPGTAEGSVTTSGTIPFNPYAGTLEDPDAGLSVEEVESDLPILAHRVAGLVFDGTSAPFLPLNAGFGQFGVDANAVCHRRRYKIGSYYSHEMCMPCGEAPGLHCECGFYALPADVTPWRETTDHVTLLVELSGRVIEHDEGYRAQHQRVVEVQVPACPYCKRQAEVIVTNGVAMTSVACRHHKPRRPDSPLVSVKDLPHVLGVPVTLQGRVEEAA